MYPFLNTSSARASRGFKNSRPIAYRAKMECACRVWASLLCCAATNSWHLSPVTSLFKFHFISPDLISLQILQAFLIATNRHSSQLILAHLSFSQLFAPKTCSKTESGRQFWSLKVKGHERRHRQKLGEKAWPQAWHNLVLDYPSKTATSTCENEASGQDTPQKLQVYKTTPEEAVAVRGQFENDPSMAGTVSHTRGRPSPSIFRGMFGAAKHTISRIPYPSKTHVVRDFLLKMKAQIVKTKLSCETSFKNWTLNIAVTIIAVTVIAVTFKAPQYRSIDFKTVFEHLWTYFIYW